MIISRKIKQFWIPQSPKSWVWMGLMFYVQVWKSFQIWPCCHGNQIQIMVAIWDLYVELSKHISPIFGCKGILADWVRISMSYFQLISLGFLQISMKPSFHRGWLILFLMYFNPAFTRGGVVAPPPLCFSDLTWLSLNRFFSSFA